MLGHSINFGFDTKNPIVKTYGDTSDDYRNECDGKRWITRDTFLPHMQTTTLKVTLENAKVLSDTGLILPCALEELGCETTSLDTLLVFGTILITVRPQFFPLKKSKW